MFKLIRFLKGYTAPALIAPLFKLMEALFELIIPLVVAKIIDVGIANNDTAYIYKMGGIMISLSVAGFLFSLTCQYLAAKASMGFGANVRGTLYKHINKLSFKELDKLGTESLITRLTNDVNQTQTGVAMFIRLVLRSPFIAIGAIVMAMTIDLKLSLIFLAMSLLVAITLYFIMSASSPVYRKIQSNLDEVALNSRENLSGARVVRAFSRQDEEQRGFEASTEKLSKTGRLAGRIAGLLNPLTFMLVNTAIILILWLGGKEVHAGNLTQGQILALVNYLSQILLSLVVLANLVVIFTKSSACAKRIDEVLNTVPSVTDEGSLPVPPVENAPSISFKDVSFTHGKSENKLFENLSFDILQGQTVGIIGATGSGKTTLINLINRFYDTDGGSVLIDGVDIKKYPFVQLRDKIGLVPQAASLFHGTLRQNLQLGKHDATDGEIWRALELALADEFVKTLKDGLDTLVFEGGKNFSGGQKQRLTIARSLIKNPQILILDDSSSALDYATDASLRKNLKTLATDMTVLIISQRASTIKNADNILVLHEGKAAGFDKHENLLLNCPLYQNIVFSQENKNGGAL